MNCFGSKDSNKEAEVQSSQINKEIKKETTKAKNNIKILLLGTGDCGKSTFLKQLSIINGDKENPNLHTIYVSVLRDNALSGAQTVIRYLKDWNIKLLPELTDPMESIINAASNYSLGVAKQIEFFASFPMIQKILTERGDEMVLQGGVLGIKYYFQNAIRYASDFTPTTEDILKSRRKTTGVIESKFEMMGHNFAVIDVGGQRSERKKWLNCFDKVTAIIFLTAINEYDMVLEEDDHTNRLVESLKLWKALTSTLCFKAIPFMLFLNKSDLFKEKIERVPLKSCFTDYEKFIEAKDVRGKHPFEQGCSYFKSLYRAQCEGKETTFVAHVTCAIDTDSIKVVWQTVSESIIETLLKDYGMM